MTLAGTVGLVATVLGGLLAGLFLAFTLAVMPGLAAAPDAVLVETMAQVNRAILSPAFLVVFLGAPLLAVVAAVVAPSGWTVAGAVLAVATLVITLAVNVPLNDALEHAVAVGPLDPAAAREAFEGRWTTANLVRALTATAGFACLVVALAAG